MCHSPQTLFLLDCSGLLLSVLYFGPDCLTLHSTSEKLCREITFSVSIVFNILHKKGQVDDELKISFHSNRPNQELSHTAKRTHRLPRKEETLQNLWTILNLMKKGNLAKQMICFRIKACRNSVTNYSDKKGK